MTGPEHFRAGEDLIAEITQPSAMNPQKRILQAGDHAEVIALAQAHFTAALAAATALGHLVEGGPLGADRYAWICAASEHPGQQRRISEANAEFEEAAK